MRLRKYPLMAEAGEGNEGGGAGAMAVDRGDTLSEYTAEIAAKEADSVEKTPEELAAEELAAAATAEEKPRASDGKFAKKDKADDKDDRIPKERFNEAVNKERAAREAAEARAAAAEARVQQEEKSVEVGQYEAHVEKLEAEHAAHILDGDKEKAAATMKQIRMTERHIAKMESEANMANATNKAVEQVRWDAAIASLEAAYPVLNPESEDYDQDMTDIVIAEQHRLMHTQGMVASKALTTAANKIVAKFQKAVAADDSGAEGLAAAKKSSSDRKADQVSKNLSTAASQPGNMKNSGKDSDKAGERELTAHNITRAELDAMPEATKAKLRGDFV